METGDGLSRSTRRQIEAKDVSEVKEMRKKIVNVDPEKFRAGENVSDRVHRSETAGIVVSARLSPEDSSTLIVLAEESGKTISQVAREAIRAFLAQRKERPAFVPEITGNGPDFDIIAFVPLGPRTANQMVEVSMGKTTGHTTHETGLRSKAC
jgi:hypothetical protein